MKKVNDTFWKTKLLSFLCLIIPIIAEILSSTKVLSISTIIVSLLAANSILFYIPVYKEDSKISFYISLGVCASFILAMFFDIEHDIVTLFLLITLTIKLINDTIKYCKKCRSIHKQQVVDFLIANLTRFACATGLSTISFVALESKYNHWLVIPSLVLLFGLYIFIRYNIDKSFDIHKTLKINKIQEPINNIPMVIDQVDEMEKMRQFFDKIESSVKKTKLYLNRNYSINDLAKIMLSNKTYISQTINIIYGDNFRAYLNKLRVEYSIELIKDNPNLRVEEVAFKSGFNSSTSFHGVFKNFTACTPGEYIQKERVRQSYESSSQ